MRTCFVARWEHENHLCHLVKKLKLQHYNPEQYAKLVRDAKFVCAICGRTAADMRNLCKPMRL